MRKAATACICALMLGLGGTAGFAASNPSGTGQPNQSCEEQTSEPSGFTDSSGFANAESQYAGNPVPSSNANSVNQASQYDVACYQVSQR